MKWISGQTGFEAYVLATFSVCSMSYLDMSKKPHVAIAMAMSSSHHHSFHTMVDYIPPDSQNNLLF